MFPGNPHDHSPCSSTPAGPSTRYGTKGQRTRHGPRTKAQRRLPTVANFGAQSHGFWSRCLRLEVEVTRHRARLASGCWSQLCRTGFDPQGFYERFLNWNSFSFPELHGASFVLALFPTLPRFQCVSICSLTARHYPCFTSGPSLHWPLAATRRLCHRQFTGLRGAGHRRGDAKHHPRSPDILSLRQGCPSLTSVSGSWLSSMAHARSFWARSA